MGAAPKALLGVRPPLRPCSNITALILLFIATGSAAQSTEPYHWPLDLPRILTSSFAEYRPGRFHMGIDLRTGPVGKNVYAAGDGYISRIRCSPYGYGKALYLQLNDGRTAVYAHLNDYTDELRDYVRAAQHARENYTVDLYPENDQFPVKRGQLIAKSGQTGIGVPHLHYEIRDYDGSPVSPWNLGIRWPDDTAPKFRKLLVAPGDEDTRINGDMLPVILDVRRTPEGIFTTDTIRVTGKIGLGVDIIDPANGGATRLGIDTIAAATDGQEIFRLIHDRVSYAHNGDGVVAYHPYLRNKGRFLLLWRWPGNHAEIFRHGESDGWFEVPSNPAPIEIAASDVAGNETRLTIPVAQHQETPSSIPANGGNGSGEVDVQTFGDTLIVSAEFSSPEPVTPTLVCETISIQRHEFRRVGDTTFRAVYQPAKTVSEVFLSVTHPRIDPVIERYHVLHAGGRTQTIKENDVVVEVAGDATYGTLFLSAEAVNVSGTKALRPAGAAVRLWPPDAPLQESITMSFPTGTDTSEHLRVYRKAGGGWRLMQTRFRNGRLDIETDSLGTFAVMKDLWRPTIRIESPSTAESLGPRPVIRAHIHDSESGVDAFRVTYRGEWLLTAYDPERDLLMWEQDEDLPAGTGPLVVEVTDGAGHTTSEERTLTIAP